RSTIRSWPTITLLTWNSASSRTAAALPAGGRAFHGMGGGSAWSDIVSSFDRNRWVGGGPAREAGPPSGSASGARRRGRSGCCRCGRCRCGVGVLLGLTGRALRGLVGGVLIGVAAETPEVAGRLRSLPSRRLPLLVGGGLIGGAAGCRGGGGWGGRGRWCRGRRRGRRRGRACRARDTEGQAGEATTDKAGYETRGCKTVFHAVSFQAGRGRADWHHHAHRS